MECGFGNSLELSEQLQVWRLNCGFERWAETVTFRLLRLT